MTHILVTGAVGQIGTDLTPALRSAFGADNVVAAGHRTEPDELFRGGGPYETLDATNYSALRQLIEDYQIDTIYHLASILSAEGELDPNRAWHVNMASLKNVLDVAVELDLNQVFWPSSIAVFGPSAAKENTPQDSVLEPTTLYGVSKVAGECLCSYYHTKHNLDVRSLRYPGLIGYKAPAGGGTTDYAVEIFSSALQHQHYSCFVRSNTVLPLMYMDDAIKAALQLMQTPPEHISVRTSYNLGALSFTAEELANELTRHLPNFRCEYQPDSRQAIADSWPNTIDDTTAQNDWGWSPDFDLETLVTTILQALTSSSKY